MCIGNASTYFNETYHSYSLPGACDTDDVTPVDISEWRLDISICGRRCACYRPYYLIARFNLPCHFWPPPPPSLIVSGQVRDSVWTTSTGGVWPHQTSAVIGDEPHCQPVPYDKAWSSLQSMHDTGDNAVYGLENMVSTPFAKWSEWHWWHSEDRGIKCQGHGQHFPKMQFSRWRHTDWCFAIRDHLVIGCFSLYDSLVCL